MPSLKPYHKFKLGAYKQGVQLSNIAYASFRSKKGKKNKSFVQVIEVLNLVFFSLSSRVELLGQTSVSMLPGHKGFAECSTF